MQAFKSFTGLAACAAGVAAVTAGVYFVRKRGEEKRRMKALEATPVEKDPVQKVPLDVLVPDYMDIPMDKTSGQKDPDAAHVLNLENRVMLLEQLLCEVDNVSESKSMVLEQERQHFRALRCHCEAISFSLAEAEERAEIAMQRRAQVEHEKSILINEVKTLKDSVEKLEKQLDETHKTPVNQVKEVEHERESILNEKYEEMLKVEKEKDELMKAHESKLRNLEFREKILEEMLFEVLRETDEKSKVCEREREAFSVLNEKYDKLREVVEQKEELIKSKKAQMRNLEKKARAVEEKLFETVTVCEEKSKESARERQAYSILMEKCDKMQEVIEDKEKILKACDSKLRYLEFREKNLEEMLFEVLRETDEKSKECAKEREAFNILDEKYDNILDVVKQKKEAIKGKKAQLRNLDKNGKAVEEKLFETVTVCEENSKVGLATAENAPESSGQREHENFDLMYQENVADFRKEVSLFSVKW